MWSDGEAIDPSPTIDQAINGRFSVAGDPVRQVQDAERRRPRGDGSTHPTTFVHDLASRLRCRKCAKTGRRPAATLLQLGWQPRHSRAEP